MKYFTGVATCISGLWGPRPPVCQENCIWKYELMILFVFFEERPRNDLRILCGVGRKTLTRSVCLDITVCDSVNSSGILHVHVHAFCTRLLVQ